MGLDCGSGKRVGSYRGRRWPTMCVLCHRERFFQRRRQQRFGLDTFSGGRNRHSADRRLSDLHPPNRAFACTGQRSALWRPFGKSGHPQLATPDVRECQLLGCQIGHDCEYRPSNQASCPNVARTILAASTPKNPRSAARVSLRPKPSVPSVT